MNILFNSIKMEKNPLRIVVKNVKSNNELLKDIRENLDHCLSDIADIKKDMKEIHELIDKEEAIEKDVEIVEEKKVEDINPSMNGINEESKAWWFLG